MRNHTPEPWEADFLSVIANGIRVAGTACTVGKMEVEQSNANRIAKCVNACAGMGDPEAEIAELKQQRDELLEALQGMIDIAADSQGVAGYHLNGVVAEWGEFEEWQAACDAIAKAKGGAS